MRLQLTLNSLVTASCILLAPSVLGQGEITLGFDDAPNQPLPWSEQGFRFGGGPLSRVSGHALDEMSLGGYFPVTYVTVMRDDRGTFDALSLEVLDYGFLEDGDFWLESDLGGYESLWGVGTIKLIGPEWVGITQLRVAVYGFGDGGGYAAHLLTDNFVVRMSESTSCPDAGAWVNSSSEAGGVDDLCASDDARWCARRATFAPGMGNLLRAEMSTTVIHTAATSLTVSVEASVDNQNVSNVSGHLQVKNQSTGAFMTIASGLVSSTDSIFTGSPSGDAADFIGPNGEVDFQFVFVQASGGPNWMGCIDQATVTVQ